MTTNAIDLHSLMIASDSRWSTYHGDYFCFVDDTGFDKIAARGFGAIICAGDAWLIEAWRKWFFADDLLPVYPETERTDGSYQGSIDITFIAAKSGKIVLNRGNYIQGDGSMFAGSGAHAAFNCFALNGCVMRCVNTANSVDLHTGGSTVFWNISTGDHNLSEPPHDITKMHHELTTRGFAMNLTSKKLIPVSDYLATLPAPEAGAANLSEFHLSAPTGKGFQPWSEDEKRELKSAVSEMIRLQQEFEP